MELLKHLIYFQTVQNLGNTYAEKVRENRLKKINQEN
jgi:hypothetical protein